MLARRLAALARVTALPSASCLSTLSGTIERRMMAAKERHGALSDRLLGDLGNDERTTVSKELATLEPSVRHWDDVVRLRGELASLQSLVASSKGNVFCWSLALIPPLRPDIELLSLATEERASLEASLQLSTRELFTSLTPRDAHDDGNALVEVSRCPHFASQGSFSIVKRSAPARVATRRCSLHATCFVSMNAMRARIDGALRFFR